MQDPQRPEKKIFIEGEKVLVEDACRRTAKLLFPDMKDFDAYEYKLFIPDATGGRIIMEDKRLLASFKFKPRVRTNASSLCFSVFLRCYCRLVCDFDAESQKRPDTGVGQAKYFSICTSPFGPLLLTLSPPLAFWLLG